MGIVAWFVFDFSWNWFLELFQSFRIFFSHLYIFLMEFICNYVFIACHEFFPSLLILNLLPYQFEYTKVWKVDMTLDYIIFLSKDGDKNVGHLQKFYDKLGIFFGCYIIGIKLS